MEGILFVTAPGYRLFAGGNRRFNGSSSNDAYLRTRNCFTGKVTFFNLIKGNDTINSSVDSEVLADVRARARNFGATCLADEYLTSSNFLATKAFHTKTLTGVVVDVLTRTTCFNV